MHSNLMNDYECGFRKLLKLKYRRGDQIIQTFCKIGSHPQIWSHLVNLWKFQNSEKSTPQSCGMHWNLMNDKKFGSIKLLKLKYRRGDQIIQTFCKIGPSPQIWSHLVNLWKFQNSEKSTPQSCGMHWNLMNDKKFGFIKLLKLKYRRGD